MTLLFDLTFRGTLAFGVVVLLDLFLASRISARARRGWWLLVPFSFLLTLPLPILSTQAFARLPGGTRWNPAWLVDIAVRVSTDQFGTSVSSLPVHISPVVFVFVAGATAYLLITVARTKSASARWSRARLCTNTALLETLEDCKAEAGITAPIGLVVSEMVGTPTILGWVRPRILLPSGLTAACTRDQLRGILFHELSHFRSMDVPMNWLFTLACVLHWFNPAVHLAFRAWRRFCEESADETAIRWLRQPSGSAYGETLLHVLRVTHGTPAPTSALAIVETVGQLRKRLAMIKHYEQKSPRYLLTATVAVLLAAGILLRPVRAAETPEDPKTVAAGAMQTWLQEIDGGKYEQSWNDAGPLFQKALPAEKWTAALEKLRKPLGSCTARKLASAIRQASAASPEGVSQGDFILAQFDTSFDNLKYAVETVTFEKAPDGTWKASGYYIKPKL